MQMEILIIKLSKQQCYEQASYSLWTEFIVFASGGKSAHFYVITPVLFSIWELEGPSLIFTR